MTDGENTAYSHLDPDRFSVGYKSENSVPYFVHEGVLARMERQLKRLFITVIVLIVALVLTNGAWLWSWMQYDYSSGTEIWAEQDGRGINVVGGGDVRFGPESIYQEDETP